MAETITNVIKLTITDFEKLIRGETIQIDGINIKYDPKAAYFIKQGMPTSYEDINIKTYEEI